MKQQELLNVLGGIALGISKLLGDDAEVVVHDLEKKEISFIANGYITGREKGYKLDEMVIESVLSFTDEDGCSIGYSSHSSQGKELRSSHFVVRDDMNQMRALLCINQDTSKLENLCQTLQHMIVRRPIKDSLKDSGDDNYIRAMTQKVIVETIEQCKPFKTEKERRIAVLQSLDSKGVFDVRDSIPIVCKMLSISQATLYNYLRELRNEDVVADSTLKL